jgi:protease IV
MTEPNHRGRSLVVRALATVGGVTLLFLVLGVISLLLLARGEGVPRRVILELDVDRGVVEAIPDDPFGALLRGSELTLRDAVEALKRAETDDRVVGLIARTGSGALGGAKVEELRAAVASFRATGKPAVLYAETFGEFGPGRGDYYLATAFEEISMQPSGDVGLAGLLAETPFLGGTFAQFGVEPQFGARHEYKDAVNLFTETEMTEPQREATLRVLQSVHATLVDAIALGRGLDTTTVRALIDRGPFFGEEAVAARLVDRLAYRDEVYDGFRDRVGGGEFLLAEQYLRRAGRPHRRGTGIALIFGTGAVQRGENTISPLVGGAAMGSESITRAFRDAVASPDIRAIVFRVDSPGGSYVASDAIWREVVRAREAGKPVVVSMGDVAGSGGYFVAMAADRIVAHPSTITGSIGVFAGKMLVGDLSSRVGVTWDDVRVGGNATMWSIVEGYSESERERLETNLDRIYDDFTRKAASGRGLSVDSIDALARGRIWTGTDAWRAGLVDELGGYEVALRLARELAGVEPDASVELRVFPRQRNWLEMLLQPSRHPGYSRTVAGMRELAGLAGVAAEVGAVARELGLFSSGGALRMPFQPRVP